MPVAQQFHCSAGVENEGYNEVCTLDAGIWGCASSPLSPHTLHEFSLYTQKHNYSARCTVIKEQPPPNFAAHWLMFFLRIREARVLISVQILSILTEVLRNSPQFLLFVGIIP